MKFYRWVLLIMSLTVFWTGSTYASTNQAQMITYADFSKINYITCSMSYIYFATTEGIIKYDKMQSEWREPLTGSVNIGNEDIRRIWSDNFDEKLYIETSQGYYEYDLLFNRWFPISEIPQIDNNYIHIKSPTIMYPPFGYNYSSDGTLIDPYGRNFHFSDIVDDRSGNLWIGIWGLGGATAGSVSHIIELLPYGLLQNDVNTIFYDHGLLLVSGDVYNSYRSGITIFNPDSNSFSYIESGINNGFPAADINCLGGDKKYIYVGTNLGLFFLNRQTQEVERTLTAQSGIPDDDVLCLKVVGDSVFVGTQEGLAVIGQVNDSIHISNPQQFANTAIYDFETTDSTIWIASEIGAFQLHFNSGRLQKYLDPRNIIFTRAYSVERYKNNLWLASDDGIERLNLKTGQVKPFLSLYQRSNRRSLAVNGKIAVVATNKGITIYFLKNKKKSREREFTVDDGLPSARINSLLLDGDYLWIGTDKGLTRFLWNDPDRVD
ncbi:MAG: hypothetical protein GXO93_02010 [FCB group bacterium]|nr:hypothetical protein [FCB group bacterium]